MKTAFPNQPGQLALLDCLACNLRRLRSDNGLSAEALGASIGVPGEQIDRIEEKRAIVIRIDLLDRLADALGVAASDLFSDATLKHSSVDTDFNGQRAELNVGPGRKPGLY